MLLSAALNMPTNLDNSAVATGLERLVFIPIPKKGNAKECSRYHTIVLISQASKIMLKNPSRYTSAVCELRTSRCTAGFKKGRGTRYQIANIHWIIEKAREFQRTSISASLTTTTNCFHNKLWKILKEMGIPDHLTSLL